jgi:hypothetical protein
VFGAKRKLCFWFVLDCGVIGTRIAVHVGAEMEQQKGCPLLRPAPTLPKTDFRRSRMSRTCPDGRTELFKVQ